MSTTTLRDPIPKEFVGRARSLLAKLKQDNIDYSAALNKIIKLLTDRTRRYPERSLRSGLLIELERSEIR